jgi:hypothetical protein
MHLLRSKYHLHTQLQFVLLLKTSSAELLVQVIDAEVKATMISGNFPQWAKW